MSKRFPLFEEPQVKAVTQVCQISSLESVVVTEVYDENGPQGGNKVSNENYVLNRWKQEFFNLYNMPSDLNSTFDGVFYEDVMSNLPHIKLFELNNDAANNHSYNSPFTME